MTTGAQAPEGEETTIFSPAAAARRGQGRESAGSEQSGIPLPRPTGPAGAAPSAGPGSLRQSPPSFVAPPAVRRTRAAPKATTLSLGRERRPEAIQAASDIYRDNPGLALAVPIFEMLVHLKGEQFVDVRAVHAQMLEELHVFETRAAAQGLSHQHVQLILYALAATADDTILQTPWAKDSDWTSKTLISAYFQETWGGERFFSLLQQMMTAPHTAVREVEFYFFCIEFGFEGKYRLASNGPGELSRIQDDLFQFLRSVRGSIKPDLSPAWRGLDMGRNKPRDLMVYWLGALGTMGALAILFLVMSITLRREAGLVAHQVEGLLVDPPPILRPAATKPQDPPPAPAPVVPAATPAPSAPPKPAAVPTLTPFQIISNALAADQKAGVVTVTERDGKVVIRTRGEVFASASTTLRAPFPDVLKHVADAIGPVTRSAEVVGFTDNVPIRSVAFPDNLALSTARAQRVADVLGSDLTVTPRPPITATGRGAADPVASNDTPEGRQSNRRVEILVTPH